MITLLFDLDDTLVDSEAAYRAGMKHIGIDPADATFLEARALVKASLTQLSPTARSRYLYFKKYLEIKNEFTAKRHLDLAEAYEQIVVTDMCSQWRTLNRKNLFLELKKITNKIFIVTNETTRMQIKKLFAFDPHGEIFTGMITSEECGVEKPDPLIYERALAQTQSEAKNSIMIGDSYINDIDGAIKCGIKTIQTLEFSKSKVLGPTTILNLNELPKILIRL